MLTAIEAEPLEALSRSLARQILCMADEQTRTLGGCGTCQSCRQFDAGAHPDRFELIPDAKGTITVDAVRGLVGEIGLRPALSASKVILVSQVEAMNTAAQNALLKTLEEPPPRVVFVLATTDPQRVLPTILSRCQRFDFRRIPLQALEQHLSWIAEQEAINITPEAVHLVAQLAQGGLRDAESLLDQLSLLPPPVEPDAVWELLGAVPEQELLQLARALQAADPLELLQSCRQLLDRGREPAAVLQGLAGLLRDLVLALAAPQHLELTGFSPANREALPALAQQLGRARLLRWQEGLRGSEVQLRQSAQPRLWLEVLLLGLLAEPQVAAIAATQAPVAQAAAPAQAPAPVSAPPAPAAATVPVPAPAGEPAAAPAPVASTTPAPEAAPAPAPAAANLDLNSLWQQILASLELPSTRMLLTQQGELVRLDNQRAVVRVAPNWAGMVQSRLPLLEQAAAKVLGQPRQVVLETGEPSQQKQPPQPPAAPATAPVASQQTPPTSQSQAAVTPPPSPETPAATTPAAPPVTAAPPPAAEPPAASANDVATPPLPANSNQLEQQAKRFADFFDGSVVSDNDAA